MKKITTIFTFIIFSSMMGCGGISYTPMTKESRNAISSVELYNLVIQDEVKPSVEMSNASLILGGGLIAAVIDSSVNKGRSLTAQDIIEPLYNAIEDYDYRKWIAQAMNPAISSEFNLDVEKNSAETILLSDDELNRKVNALADDEALIYLSSFYNFVNNSKTLATSTRAFVYMKPKIDDENKSKKSKKEDVQLIYYNTHNFLSKSVGEGSTHSIDLWADNEGKLFRETLNSSLKATVNMLMYDLQPELNELCSKSVKIEYNNIMGVVKEKGILVKQNQNRDIVRANDGSLISMSEGVKLVKNQKPNQACVS